MEASKIPLILFVSSGHGWKEQLRNRSCNDCHQSEKRCLASRIIAIHSSTHWKHWFESSPIMLTPNRKWCSSIICNKGCSCFCLSENFCCISDQLPERGAIVPVFIENSGTITMLLTLAVSGFFISGLRMYFRVLASILLVHNAHHGEVCRCICNKLQFHGHDRCSEPAFSCCYLCKHAILL